MKFRLKLNLIQFCNKTKKIIYQDCLRDILLRLKRDFYGPYFIFIVRRTFFVDSVFLQGNQVAIDGEWNFSDSEF